MWFSGQWVHAPQTPFDANNIRYPVGSLPAYITLITWNVDAQRPYAIQRLEAALDHLQFHAFPGYNGGQPPPCLILLQELRRDAFPALLAHPWVQAWFMVGPGSPEEGWPRGAWYGYGTVTLVARSTMLTAAACVQFGESEMGRNALVTDVLFAGAEPQARVLRVVNAHLESLPAGAQRRAAQLGTIARLLRWGGGSGSVVVGGIVGGDMNAIVPSDAMLPEQNGLLDAWEERRRWDGRGVGSEGGDEDGVTWGHQPPCEFPPGRLDKILYTDSDAFEVRDIRKLAIGLQMPTPEGRVDWVSDHYALLCQVEARQAT
jgi:tyrosyl-DNA phosphodiesterase 2